MIIYLYSIHKIESSSTSSSGLYTNVYTCALMIGLGGTIHKHNCQTISIFSFSLSPFLCNYLCPPYSWQEKKSRFRTIIDLLLSLFFFFELLDTIRGRSSETNLVKRVKKEREREIERENLHTSNAHLYWIYLYILRSMWVFGVCTYNVRITFCTF